MLRNPSGGTASSSPKKIFSSVRFVLFGFDSVSEAQYRSELVDGGGVDVGLYDSSCTHVIVSGRVFDDPVCVAARNDRKILVTELWIDDSLDIGMLVDSTKVIYRPVRDLSGIPGSKSLHICLTGYQRQERDDIMRMVSLMGGRFSKPLIANQATHLICYKFEGEKYELAKKVNIKLVNHRWLEDCLKSWEILPVDNYNKSGWELETLEAEAMDSEEEAEDADRKIKYNSNGEPCSSRGEISGIMASGTLVDTRNLNLQKDIFYAQPSDHSVNNQRLSTPNKENSSVKATDICNTKNQVQVFGHPEDRPPEQFPDNHCIGNVKSKQPNTSDLNMKYNSLPSSLRNNFMDMTSYEEEMKLSPLRYSRKASEKVVSPEERFNNLSTPHKVMKEELNMKRDANNSSAESNNNAAMKLTHSNLDVEGQTHALPQKRKLCVSRIGSKSLKTDHISRTSGLLNASTSIKSAELDSLHLQQEHEDMLTLTEADASISCALLQLQNASASVSLTSPKLAQEDSRTCIDHGPSTSRLPGHLDAFVSPQYEIGDGHTPDNFEGTALVKLRGLEHGSLPKSTSLGYKRKSLKLRNSTPIDNISGISTSKSDKMDDEPLCVPSKPSLGGSVCMRYEAVFGVGTMCDITSPEAMALSDCHEKNVTGPAEDRSTGNDANFCRSPLVGDGGNVNEASIGVSVPEASLRSMNKSGTPVKSHNFDGVSIKHKPGFYNKVTEQHEITGEDEKVISSALLDTKVKNSSTEIPGLSKQNKENEGSICCNRMVIASKNISCRLKARSRNDSKEKSSSTALKNINSKKKGIKSGNGIVGLENEDNCKEKVGKDDSMEEQAEVKQYQSPEINSKAIKDEKYLVPGKGNRIKDTCNFSVKEDEGCGLTVKKKCKSSVGANISSGDNNINSLLKQNCLSAAFSEPMCFILSGTHAQRKEFHLIISRLRGRTFKGSHNWSYEATHFIVPDTVRRTEKFFAAAAAGRWILRSDYLTASSKAGKFLDEEPFEWYRNGLSEDGAINLEAPRKWRTLKQKTGHGAFYGMRIIIYGECIAPSLDTLKRALKAGDGTILATSPPYTRFLKSGVDIAVVSVSMPHVDVWVQEFLRHEIPCVLADYLVEYVCKPGYSLERHVLYKTHTWLEKLFANLQSRISEETASVKGSDEDSSDDLICSVCGSRERGEVMLICGNDAGTLGCGLGTHVDCCDPPLAAVPENDWFCPSCSKKIERKNPTKRTKAKLKKGK